MELKLLRKIIINCYSITFSNIDKVIVKDIAKNIFSTAKKNKGIYGRFDPNEANVKTIIKMLMLIIIIIYVSEI